MKGIIRSKSIKLPNWGRDGKGLFNCTLLFLQGFAGGISPEQGFLVILQPGKLRPKSVLASRQCWKRHNDLCYPLPWFHFLIISSFSPKLFIFLFYLMRLHVFCKLLKGKGIHKWINQTKNSNHRRLENYHISIIEFLVTHYPFNLTYSLRLLG